MIIRSQNMQFQQPFRKLRLDLVLPLYIISEINEALFEQFG